MEENKEEKVLTKKELKLKAEEMKLEAKQKKMEEKAEIPANGGLFANAKNGADALQKLKKD